MIFLCGRPLSRLLDVAAPLPPDVPVERSPAVSWPLASSLALVVLETTLLGVVEGDGGAFYVSNAYLLAGGVASAIRERRVARWEDEHDIEVLRVRRRLGSSWYYTRPR